MEKIKDIKDIKYMIDNASDINDNIILNPIYNNAKSFYNKAYVIQVFYDNYIIYCLYSYNTLVCGIVYNNDKAKYILNAEIQEKLLFSNTTLRHIKEFLIQNIDVLRLSHLIDGKITKSDIIKNNNKILN